ncbi:reductase [Streptomyces sp. NRRL S-1813]|uniref:reductase n=1 Tax=Streptomyces sp. NRRL S-1813 TaxID=1463888 RepID=UPI001F2B6EE8|nr:reductase [Streptomyces sp. NRRL S-1813]
MTEELFTHADTHASCDPARGHHDPPPGAFSVRGDRLRAGGTVGLERGKSDVVVDTWAGAPSAVRDAARLLADRTERYVYVSSRSVYRHPAPAGLSEISPVVDDASPDDGEVGYPQAKRGWELAVEDVFGDRSLLVRAGLILGPRENVGRLPWWLSRIARGGPVPAPGPWHLPLQYIDARDLAGWTLDAAKRGLDGPYNLVSPPGHTRSCELLEACVRVTGARAELLWADPDAVLAADIQPWTELPIWLPPGESHRALHQPDVSRAVATGLRCRPVTETVADTWTWMRDRGGRVPQRPGHSPVGLPPEKEARLLRVLGR